MNPNKVKILAANIILAIGGVLVIWLDEMYDAANILFGVPKQSINLPEALLESGIFLLLVVVNLFVIRALLKQIKHLEGMTVVCSFCKKVRVHDTWIPIEQFLTEKSELQFSHSFCQECSKKHYGIS